jgi:UDP-2,3-diacylglucosamine hydrolase
MHESIFEPSLNKNLPLGIIAGNGYLPLELAGNIKERGFDIITVAHIGETEEKIKELSKHCVWIKVGELKKIVNTLNKYKVQNVFFAGGIRRGSLIKGVKLDALAIKMLFRIGSFKDDAVLRGIADEIERKGIKVLDPSLFLKESVVRSGILTKRSLTDEEKRAARIGWEACITIGSLDIGQTVVVNGGVVVAVEAVEGTDAAILRGGSVSGKGGVVVKLPKVIQDRRFDLPGLGTRTIESMVSAEATALILQNQGALIINPTEFLQKADQHNISIAVFRNKEEIV